MKRPRSTSDADLVSQSATHSDASSQKRPRAPHSPLRATPKATASPNVFGPDSDSDTAPATVRPHLPIRAEANPGLPISTGDLNAHLHRRPDQQLPLPPSRSEHTNAKPSGSSPPEQSQANVPSFIPTDIIDPSTASDGILAGSHRRPTLSRRPLPKFLPFEASSDSDDNDDNDDAEAAPVEPPSANGALRPASNAPEEDSLDIFMNSLSSAPARPTPRAQPLSPSSDSDTSGLLTETLPVSDAPSRSGTDLQSAEAAARAADTERRSLTLPAVDHSSISYPPIRKALYAPLARHAGLSKSALAEHLAAARVSMSGPGAPMCPVSAFADVALALPQALLAQLLSLFDAPTPVQCAALPVALAGRDVLATADTGSGKTLAFLVPLLAHARAQTGGGGGGSVGGRGPRVLILAPTRELAAQIAREARRFGAPLSLSVALVTGGTGKFEQFRVLRDSGARVLVATPGRLIDLLKMRACSLQTVSALALDEADRMLDLGFGGQVAALLGQIRPDAQRLLFSATLPNRVLRLAAAHLNEPVRIAAVGAIAAGAAVTQPMVCAGVRERYVSIHQERGRWDWLRAQMPGLVRDGLVIVFCRTRGGCASLANRVRAEGVPVACVHGETEQTDRTGLLRLFKEGEVRVLVTTDLAARGLDIADVRSVVNYEAAKDWEWHVHRVGRTGRAERTGDAYTLLCRDSGLDCSFAEKAMAAFLKANVGPPKDLLAFTKICRGSR